MQEMKSLLDISGIGDPSVPLHLRYSKLAIVTTEEYALGLVRLERSENGDIVALSAFKRDRSTLLEMAKLAAQYGLEIKGLDDAVRSSSGKTKVAQVDDSMVLSESDTSVGPVESDRYVGEDACGLCLGRKATPFSRGGINRWRGCRRCKATGRNLKAA